MIPHHSVRQLGQQFFCRFCLGSLMQLPLASGLTNSGVSRGSQPGWVPCSISMWLTRASSQHGDLKAVVEETKPHSSGQVIMESQLLSHWPKQITWPSPESMWRGLPGAGIYKEKTYWGPSVPHTSILSQKPLAPKPEYSSCNGE